MIITLAINDLHQLIFSPAFISITHIKNTFDPFFTFFSNEVI